jgi:hypothetical protein
MQHAYLVFPCKTEKCPAVYKAAYLGASNPGKPPEIPVTRLNWGCTVCHTIHPYTQEDMHLSFEAVAPQPGEVFPHDLTE